MDVETYQRERHKLLGVLGPMAESEELVDGQKYLFQIWRTPDGGEVRIEHPKTDTQRAATIRRLKKHLGLNGAMPPIIQDD